MKLFPVLSTLTDKNPLETALSNSIYKRFSA